MQKKLKNISKRFLATLMAFAILFQMFAPTLVLADNFEDVNEVTIGGSPTIEEKTYKYENGSVNITINRNNLIFEVYTPTFEVEANDIVKITLTPEAGFNASLRNEGNGATLPLIENSYEFIVHSDADSTLELTPSFSYNDSSVDNLKFDFTINGESFTNVSIGDNVLVPENFNMDTLEEFYITKIVDGENKTYTYAAEEYSYDLLDNEGKHILETHFIKKSDNYVNLRMVSHNENILSTDLDKYNKTADDYFGLYITGLKLVKSGFRGVQITTDVMPDNYDFTVWNGVDLGGTTINKPGVVTAYYGEDTINLNSQSSSQIKKIELEEKGVPSSAIEINNENGTIKVLSNYYNQIPVKVELEDGTVGYITINRIGIFIGDLNKNQDTFYHGAFNTNANGNLNVQTDMQRLVAVFYHDNETDYEDYDLIVNIIYTDGTTETKMATGVGSVDNEDGQIIGSDYILWSGDSIDNSLSKVSVTAVKKGATTDETSFGGAAFGSGSGVVWEKR